MFIYTARIPKKRLLAGGITLLCCLAVVLTAVLLLSGSRAASAGAEVKGIRDNDDRVSFLTGLGWEVSDTPIASEELLVPAKFDENYADYLALPAQQGFDLTKYCGRKIQRYTYEVRNHPSGESGVQVSLLVYRSTIIGGEVVSPSAGFLHGLVYPQGAAPSPSQSVLAPDDADILVLRDSRGHDGLLAA